MENVDKKPPFHSFSFTLVENRSPRAALRMSVAEGGMYELHVQKGSAANPTSQFTRQVPWQVAERLRDALQKAGVFGWEEAYGDTASPGSRRWSVSTVFEEGVFALSSKGGSDVPPGFDAMLDELYRLDFPRPGKKAGAGGAGGSIDAGSSGGMAGAIGSGGAAGMSGIGSALNSLGLGRMGSVGGMSAGDVGAYASAGTGGVGGVDFSKLAEMMGAFGAGGPGDAQDEFADMLSEAQRNPQALQQRMKDEFRHMTPDEQRQLIDMLVASGMGSREYWERFFRG